jgi:putative sterol carrier protein
MALKVFSEEWLKAYKEAINKSPYREAGKDWRAGPVALVIVKNPDVGLEQDVGLWLDLHEGVCRDALVCVREKAATAPFCITGEYSQWKQVLLKELDPIKGMMQGKLKLKGDLPTIVRYVKAAQELVNAASNVDTEFLD